MSIKIAPDADAPTIAVELAILNPLPDYDIEDVDAAVPRDVDGILVTQGFRDLVDDARGALEPMLAQAKLELVQFTGAICPDGSVFHPGLWIVLRETGMGAGNPASATARAGANRIAQEIVHRFGLS
jgi:hypothetical protein